MHADVTLLPRGQFLERPNVLLGTDIELASTFIKLLFDGLALLLMRLAVLVLALLVAVPDALASVALLDGVALLSTSRAELGCGPVILPFQGFAERHGAELLSSRRCSFLFRWYHGLCC